MPAFLKHAQFLARPEAAVLCSAQSAPLTPGAAAVSSLNTYAVFRVGQPKRRLGGQATWCIGRRQKTTIASNTS